MIVRCVSCGEAVRWVLEAGPWEIDPMDVDDAVAAPAGGSGVLSFRVSTVVGLAFRCPKGHDQRAHPPTLATSFEVRRDG